MFLFEMTNGRKKLAYGTDVEDALEVLALRLSTDEMAQVIPDNCIKISHREIQRYVPLLG
jgi:hypothetical protein